ncbi:MAG: hypothetical protein M1825_005816 [Sarcosagium campestre]|nr:MAG: hypothetical protein M1825_005816 [Sarcosagium campestre]
MFGSSSKLSLSTPQAEGNATTDTTPRGFGTAKRFGGDSSSHGRSNPFNNIAPLTTSNVASPTSGASSAFGLGSGAFASFGTAKTPKSPGNALDFVGSGVPTSATAQDSQRNDRDRSRDGSGTVLRGKGSSSSLLESSTTIQSERSLRYTWVVWYRPPTSKYSDYEKSTIPLASFSTVDSFWSIYSHLKRPSSLPSVSDYHIFKAGVRPVWEDKENKRGGKWIVRLKKGVADRYWEDLLLAIVGDQFAEAGEEVCGAVLSVRGGEDVLSVWTRIDGGRNIKIRETIKRLLAFPPDTNIVWKSHDDSMAQRSQIEQARLEKGGTTNNSHVPQERRHAQGKDEIHSDRHK